MHAPRPELRVRRARDPAVLRAVAGLPVRAVQHAVAVRRAVAVRVTQRTPAVVHVQRVCQRALAAAIRRRRLERRPLVVFPERLLLPEPAADETRDAVRRARLEVVARAQRERRRAGHNHRLGEGHEEVHLVAALVRVVARPKQGVRNCARPSPPPRRRRVRHVNRERRARRVNRRRRRKRHRVVRHSVHHVPPPRRVQQHVPVGAVHRLESDRVTRLEIVRRRGVHARVRARARIGAGRAPQLREARGGAVCEGRRARVRRVARDARHHRLQSRRDVARGHAGVSLRGRLPCVQRAGPTAGFVDPHAVVLVEAAPRAAQGALSRASAEVRRQAAPARALHAVETRRLPVPARARHVRLAVVARRARLRAGPRVAEAVRQIIKPDPARVIAGHGRRQQRAAATAFGAFRILGDVLGAVFGAVFGAFLVVVAGGQKRARRAHARRFLAVAARGEPLLLDVVVRLETHQLSLQRGHPRQHVRVVDVFVLGCGLMTLQDDFFVARGFLVRDLPDRQLDAAVLVHERILEKRVVLRLEVRVANAVRVRAERRSVRHERAQFHVHRRVLLEVRRVRERVLHVLPVLPRPIAPAAEEGGKVRRLRARARDNGEAQHQHQERPRGETHRRARSR